MERNLNSAHFLLSEKLTGQLSTQICKSGKNMALENDKQLLSLLGSLSGKILTDDDDG